MKNLYELKREALEILKENGELFVDMINELDSYNSFADGFRAYPMWEIDDMFYDCKVSEFLDKLSSDFNKNDDYFIDSCYGLSSTDNIENHYRDNVSEDELLDEIIENHDHIYFSDSDFEELIRSIANYDESEEDENTAA